jgi:hypothetical protein
MYDIDAVEGWFEAQQSRDRSNEDAFLRRAQVYEALVLTPVYQQVKDHIFKTFIYQTPLISLSEKGPMQAFGTYLKQLGIRFFFDEIENSVAEAKRIIEKRKGESLP